MAAYRRATDLDGRNLQARFALADIVERAGGPSAATEAQPQIEQMLAMAPGSLAVMVERARLAARMADRIRLGESVSLLDERAAGWPPAAVEQLAAFRSALDAADYAGAGRALAFLRTVLARVPEFRDSLSAVRVPAPVLLKLVPMLVTLAPVRSNVMLAPPLPLVTDELPAML